MHQDNNADTRMFLSMFEKVKNPFLDLDDGRAKERIAFKAEHEDVID